ncbi:MAG: SDR family oxidoreductase [Clostridia bacterium]|nr:SDR family oxidoreductase [Clostridia bacterium]
MKFMNKTALVTGAAVGIGRAAAILLAQGGANLILIDLNIEKLEAVKAELSEYKVKCIAYKCDVRNETEVNEVVKKSIDEFGRIDILVNNAALWRSYTPFLDTPIDDWKKYFEVNVMGCVYCTRAVLPSMIENRWGRIINVASVAGVYGNANMVNYSATKGAVISLTKALAKEVSDKGVTVNAVSPGSVSSSENDDIDYTKPSELSFIGRTGSDRENANLICFLASEDSSYISGQNIQIDGCRKKQ